MPNNTYVYGLQPGQQCRPHRVYAREHWFAAWTPIDYLFADSLTWCLAPAIGQASLARRFGRGMRQGELNPAAVARLASGSRWFIKVEIDMTHLAANTFIRWYGTLETTTEERAALLIDGKVRVPTGVERFTALALEQLWYRTPIKHSLWRNSTSGAEHKVERVIAFNRPNAAGAAEGNRSAARGRRSYCFTDRVGVGDQFWSTRDACEYLAAHHGPKGRFDIAQPYWRIDVAARDLLPNWDKPSIDATEKNLGETLDELMPRSRMLGWRLVVDESDPTDPSPHIKLTPVSLLGADVVTAAGNRLAANPRRVWAIADGVPDFKHAVKATSGQRFDQVRVRGAQATSTCTLSFADGTLEKGWPADLEIEYTAGFSADGGYAALGTHDKQIRNNEVRHRDKLFPVFRRFAIPANWSGSVKDGLGGGAANVVFPTVPGGDVPYPVCPRDLTVQPTVPMLEGFNYEATGSTTLFVGPVRESEGPHERLPPVVLFKSPVAARYFHAERVGDGAGLETTTYADDLQFSCRVEVPASDRSVLLHVMGRAQHAISASDFAPLPVDPYAGVWDWSDALFTVALPDDRHCEGVWPSDAIAKQNVIGCRRDLLLDAGDKYRLDYLVAGTVMGVEADGTLVRSGGVSWIQDDRELLIDRARQAYEYYRQTRTAVAIQTPRLVAALDLRLGDYLETIGQIDPKTIGSVVSQVELQIPDGDGVPELTITTAFAELDPQSLLV